MTERTLNEEERIRRAEEIYYRRKNLGEPKQEYTTLNLGEKKDYRLFRKMLLQIIACLFIYLIFFSIQNSNYIFSEQFINKTKEILAYDINFEEIKNMTVNYYNELKKLIVIEQAEEKKEETLDVNENNTDENKVEENIEENINAETGDDVLYKEDASSVSQIEEDADYIKNNYSLIVPLKRNNYIKIWC